MCRAWTALLLRLPLAQAFLLLPTISVAKRRFAGTKVLSDKV